jgi:hypothetical protein
MAKKTAAKRSPKFIPCTIQRLPPELLVPAAQTATAENPANAPRPGAVAALVRLLGSILFPERPEEERPEIPPEPPHIALLTEKYWGVGGKVIPTYFMDTQDTTLKNKLLASFNAWQDNVKWVESSAGNSLARVSRQRGGYWSYLGTDYAHIPQNQPTMNLERWTLNTPESEWLRVPTHESGHGRGYPHEHLRRALVDFLDRAKTIAYFGQTQGWSPQEVMAQVLTPLDEASLMATPADSDSIMCYQLPASITTNGQPIRGGSHINATDLAFSQQRYPSPNAPPPPPPGTGAVITFAQDVKAGSYKIVPA